MKLVDGRERMATSARSTGEIGVDVDEHRAGEVGLVVLVAALVMVGEVEPAVADDCRGRQLGIGEPRQRVRRQRSMARCDASQPLRRDWSVIRHVVMFQFTDDTTVEQIDDYERSLVDYVATLEGVESYRIGRDARINPGTYDFSIVAEFADEAAFREYFDGERHKRDPARHGVDDRGQGIVAVALRLTR